MRSCSACQHPQRPLIDDQLLRKVSARAIGERVDPPLSQWVILRHQKHMERGTVLERVEEIDPNCSLISRIEDVMHRVDSVAVAAARAKNWNAATGALRELRCSLELLAKISGQLQTGSRPISVAVGVNIDQRSQHAGTMSADQLELSIAEEVSNATAGFDAAEIQRLKALLACNGHATPLLSR